MKVLLLGEFSALYKNLKEGLQELGHEVLHAGTGDGFKKIPVDIDWSSNLPSPFSKIHNRLKPLMLLPQFKGFEVVQMVNAFTLNMSYFPRDYFIKQIKKNNGKFFLSGAGDDAYFWHYGRKSLRYGIYEDFLKYDIQSDSCWLESEQALEKNNWIVEQSDGVIPIMYEYEESYRNCSKRLATIPIPMNLNKIEYQDNSVKNKLVVFHGLNRYGFKGTRHVEEAFEYLNSKYPNDIEARIDGNMPLDEYLQLMRRTNVVVDQMNSYSLGVNGIYALAMGKVVVGGAEPESLTSLGVAYSPVINTLPNAADLIKKIESLLEQRNDIQELGFQSRQFAEQVHSHTKVAQQYVDVWKNS